MRQPRNDFGLSKEMNEELGREGKKMPFIAATMLFSKFTKLSSTCTELSTL